MSIPEEIPLINESVANTNDASLDITKACESEPIQIFIYPPKNKQFRFDENTNTIEVESLQVENSCQTTSLTPLVEQCNIIGDECDRFLHSTPVKNLKYEYKDEQFQIDEIIKIEKVFSESKLKKECFLKGCKWSGDGMCLLSNSEDNVVRLFELSDNLLDHPRNDIEPVLQMKEGGTVYDYVWYPKMTSLDPVTCVFASTSQDSPIHLWDAYTGQLRATYQPINQYDEVTSAYSLAFSPDGSKLYSGFKKRLRIFDVCQPGRTFEERNLKTKENVIFQSNIISSICINPAMPSLYVLGSYDKTIGVYTEPEGDLLCLLKGHSGGITQLIFSKNGNHLFSGGRKDNEILCWDMRNPGKVVFTIERKVDTQQKIMFDLSPDQKYLVTGTTDHQIKIYDVLNTSVESGTVLKEACSFPGHEDCVNGVQFHPNLFMFASCSGQRHLSVASDDEDEESRDRNLTVENSIKLWSFNKLSVCGAPEERKEAEK